MTPPLPSDHLAEARALAVTFIRHVMAIVGDELRPRIAARALSSLAPPHITLLVGELARRSRDDVRAADALTAVSRALARELVDPDLVAASLAAARSRADRAAEAILASGPAERHYNPDEEKFIDRRMRATPLGSRRAMTRSGDIDQLRRLAHDQDPKVLKQLLLNPRVTELEAIIIASRRPTQPVALEAVLTSRFGLNRRIRVAVAHNPYATLALAARAMTSLSRIELVNIADDEKVSPAVRAHARSLATTRSVRPVDRAAAAPPPTDDGSLDALLARLEDGDVADLEVWAVDPSLGEP